MRKIIAFLCLPIFLWIAACSGSDGGPQKNIRMFEDKPQNYPDCLIQLSNATEVGYYQLGGTYQLKYSLTVQYPATEAIAEISNELKRLNWKPLPEDDLNSGLASSHVLGWSQFEDGTKNPQETVHQWLADWDNVSEDVVTYVFRYRYKTQGRQDFKTMSVVAIFTPASVRKAMHKAIAGGQQPSVRQ